MSAPTNLIVPSEYPMVTQNERAPLYNTSHAEQQLLLQQAVALLTSESGFSIANEKTRELLRQTGMVNMFVFLRYIAGFANNFTRLSPDLHLDMCNFYQMTRYPGTKAAGFLFRGGFKCQEVHEEVYTRNRGVVGVGDLRVGDRLVGVTDRLLSHDVTVEGTAYDQMPGYKVTLKSGRSFTVGRGHRVLHSGGWAAVEELEAKDRIAVLDYRPGARPVNDTDYLVGLYLGDGGWTGHNDLPCITTADREIVQFLEEYWGDLWHDGKYGYRLRGGSKFFKEQLGLTREYAINKAIPPQYEGSAGVLRGLMDTDGTCGHNVTFSTASRRLARDVTRNLAYFRIYASIKQHKSPSEHGVFWQVSITGRDDLIKYRNAIGFRIQRKAKALDKAIAKGTGNSNYKRTIPAEWFDDLGVEAVRELRRMGHNVWHGYATTITKARRLAREAGRCREVELWTDNDVVWDVVDSVEAVGVIDVVHVQVDGPHNYADAYNVIHHNSTVWTYGGTAWDIIRDPDWEEVLASNIIDRSVEFNGYIQEIFTDNELVQFLYPEWVPESTHGAHWNAKETRVPCKHGGKPNIRLVAVGGSIQGIHGRSFKTDDLIGEHMLDSTRQLGADNEKASNWYRAATRNIPRPLRDSIVFLCGTRYGPGDAYTHQWGDIKKFYGYTQGEPYEVKDGGEWTVYYRTVREDHGDGKGEQPVFPEEYTNEYLDKVMLEDPWQYWTQMMNMSTYSGLSEFIDYQLKECKLDVNEQGRYVVSYFDHELMQDVSEPLDEMCVVQGCDPAASDKKRSTRTSKSAAVVLARNWKDMRFWLRVDSGYVESTKMVDWLFANWQRFKGYMEKTALEMQGPFKVLRGFLRQEQTDRNMAINLKPVSAKGDKDARIRIHLQPPFDRGQAYATQTAHTAIMSEMSVFPDGHNKDILDAMAIAEAASYRPGAPDDEDDEDVVKRPQGVRSAVTGY